jgi:serine/threonine protein kinase
MSVPRRLGINGYASPEPTQSRSIAPPAKGGLAPLLNHLRLNGAPTDANGTAAPAGDGNNSASASPANSPHNSPSAHPRSPGGFNAALYSPKPSPGVRVAVPSPAPTAASTPPASYTVLPALDRCHRYVVTGTLQQSLFGVVKLAFDRQLRVQVAIKISRRERAAIQQTRSGVSVLENVKREAAVMRYMHERSSAAHGTSVDATRMTLQDYSSGAAKKAKLSSRALQAQKANMDESDMAVDHVQIKKENGLSVDSPPPSADSDNDSSDEARMSVNVDDNADELSAVGEQYICKFVEELEDEYFHYLVTEFVPAGDLYSMLTSFPQHRLSEAAARTLFTQMVLGTKWMHDRNIAHLDMSLENMCMDANDVIRVIDFGVAAIHPFTPTSYASAQSYFAFTSATTPMPPSHKPNGPITSSFVCKPVKELYNKPGKIRYMSPELFQGLPWDAFSNDIFSLGVILYSLLTGRPPFQQSESTDVWFHVIYSGQWLTPQIRKQPSAHVYTHLSESALDLVNRILKPQEVRLNCEQILHHPWMTQTTS